MIDMHSVIVGNNLAILILFKFIKNSVPQNMIWQAMTIGVQEFEQEH